MPKRKVTAICGDINTFTELIQIMPADRQKIAGNLAQELVFMAKTLDRLRAEVTDGGVVDREKNKESAALKSYNTTIQRYSLVYKQFVDMLPKAPVAPEGRLYDFIKQS